MHTPAADTFDPGHVVEAKLAPHALLDFDPMLRRLLGGHQLFVKQADGRWRPRGCSLGLAQCFDYADLLGPAPQG
ncbi:hypothetical protein FN976_12340 [Caenimonas sedimenti]|uniref:Uncharacterized protein n=1 Tax=Caenimonas sedimenti TaxID=2596921 RepID=A0A562ZRW0_9BURK|nr:hypothetical protein [Caenimonas sedimenti]TWO71101.1 hypothetical protein FN976_12340 [Caenimonas sedimenti]